MELAELVPVTQPLDGLRTRAVHAGESPDPATGATSPNLVMSTTYLAPPGAASLSPDGMPADTGFLYSRWGSPTVRQLERRLADLERGEDAVAFASGMAAISAVMLQVLRPGDHLVYTDVCYPGVPEFVRLYLLPFGIEATAANFSDLAEVRRAIRPNTRLLHAETPSNPLLRLTDVAAVAALAHEHGAELLVDSTIATPVATVPLALGADYVAHSLTKYLSGHGDLLGGIVVGRAQAMGELRRRAVIHLGGALSPFNAWLTLRGLSTLVLRMNAHSEAALHVARFLETRDSVIRVHYPGLPSHPQHELALRQMQVRSGLMSFQAHGGALLAQRLRSTLRIIHCAVSLGHQRSLLYYLATDDMQSLSYQLDDAHLADFRALAGEGVFRLSVGLEDPDDLCRDLTRLF